jgi:type IV pilus assembly protein PilW
MKTAAAPLRRPRSRQLGRSLVELMIGITVALAITSAVAAAYVGVSRTAKFSAELAGIADSGQVVMQLIGDSIRQAGYGEIVGSDLVLGASQVGSYRSQTMFADGASVIGCSGARFADDTARDPVCGSPLDPNFDALMVRFQAEAVIPPDQGRIDDCLGVAVPAEDLPADHAGRVHAAARPMVQNAYFGGGGALWCRGGGRATAATVFAPAQQLVSNVEQFKVFYGFDDMRHANPDSAPATTARSIRDAAWINALPAASNPWEFVVTVHVCMVIRSDPDASAKPSQRAADTYSRCPLTEAEAAGALPTVSMTDRVLRRTYAQTFTVRSRSPANPRQFLP